jgi:archaemetzincin
MLLVSCQSLEDQYKVSTTHRIIQIQPLGNISITDVQFLKERIEQFYPVRIQICPSKPLPTHSFYAPRNRYRADSLIAWLKSQKPDSVSGVVGLTTSDISTTKGKYKDYGVMGLGYQPGDACVISTFRLKKTTVNQKHFQQRLFKVVVHEMGHNFGLPHCPNQHCIMVDAEGKMKLDGEKELCKNCQSKIQFN